MHSTTPATLRKEPGRLQQLTSAAFFCASISFLTGGAVAQTLPNGGSLMGAISVPGEQDTFYFQAGAGEGIQIRVTDLNQGALYPRITLYQPNGTQMPYANDATVAALSATAPTSGTFRVVVQDVSSGAQATGPYQIHFAKAPGANEGGALINGGAVQDRIDLGDIDSYTFSIQAGESFQLRIADLTMGSLYPRITLYDPNGYQLTYSNGPTVAAINDTATRSGVHTVVVTDVSSGSDGVGNYSLEYVRAPGANELGALVSGGSITDRIDLGDLDSFTFSIQAGEGFQLRVADLNAGALYPRITLYDPYGAQVTYANDPTVTALNNQTATRSGIYTVVVSDVSSGMDGVGPYTLHFVSMPGANEHGFLLNGGALCERIDLGDIDSYTFLIGAGEGFQLRISDTNLGALYPRLTLYNPLGTYVTYSNDPSVTALDGVATLGGVYTVIVTDVSSGMTGTGDYCLEFTRAPGANEGGFLLDNVLRSDAITLGDLDSYSFLGFASELASITVTDTVAGGLYPRITLYDPYGAYITYDNNTTVATISHRLLLSGVYTVVVSDVSSGLASTGPYSLLVTGSGHDPRGVRNIVGARELPGDPILLDIGGDPNYGPKIGNAQQPFNVALDCSAAAAPSFGVFQMWTSHSVTPILTPWGHFYGRGALVLTSSISHTRTVEPWFPMGTGYPLPMDTQLIGVPFTIQGFVGGFGAVGRFTNAITQTIGN